MRPARLPWTVVAVSLFASLTACQPAPPAPDEVRARITDDLGNVLRELKAASGGSTRDLPGGAALSLLEQLMGGTTSAASAAQPGDPIGAGFDIDAAIKWLNESVFTDASSLGDGIYQVPAALVCSTASVDSSGASTTSIDAECAANLAKAQLRIRVESNDSTLRFAIQLDADHDEPLAISLGRTTLAVAIDLDSASAAIMALAPLFGRKAPNARLSGSATAAVEIMGPAHARLSLDFDRSLAVAIADQGASLDGPDATRFASVAAHVVSVELDGAAALAHGVIGLGETSLHVPGDATTATTDVDLAGATVNATYTAGTVTLAKVSLGQRTSSIFKNGQRAVAIDLNASDDRKLDATITTDAATGRETLSVTPRLDLVQAVDRGVLGTTGKVYDVTRLRLDGSLRAAGGSTATEIATGSLSVETNPGSYGFSATAGQCVTSKQVTDATSGTLYTQFTVGGC